MKQHFLLLSSLALLLLASCENNGSSSTVSDICGNSYKIVAIGSQTWMAENMKCNKYDTQSEAYNEGRKSIQSSNVLVYTPYYVDATNKGNWQTKYGDYSGNLSSTQISKLGYQYNWAAAVGLADGKTQKTAFSGNRQGICPNGWHVPTQAEWDNLFTFIGSDYNMVGKKIKATSGWYQAGSGTDNYGFAALPSGFIVSDISVNGIGRYAYFATSRPVGDNINAYAISLKYDGDGCAVNNYGKSSGTSVRCVKN